jgi:hypothetical protein
VTLNFARGDAAVSTMAETMTAEQARQIIAQPAWLDPVWLDGWAAGYAAGYDTRDATLVAPVLDQLAQDLAQLDRTTFVEPGRFDRQQRINREVADDRHARPVRQTSDWPAVKIPGGGV